MEQHITYCTADDGVRIAYATAGTGPPVVFAPITAGHLELDWQDSGWQRLLGPLAERHQLVRYDKRGCGLSEREPEDVSLEGLLLDLEAVVDAAGLDQFALAGFSQGARTALLYAARHPERVSRLAVYGGSAWQKPSERRDRAMAALKDLIRSDSRTGLAALSFAVTRGTTPDEAARYHRDFMAPLDPETTARALGENAVVDLRADLRLIRAPTLVIHRRDDINVRLNNASEIVAGIPGARLVQLAGEVHFPQFGDVEELARVLGAFLSGDEEVELPESVADPGFGTARIVSLTLSAREAEVLELLALGKTNQQIADELVISTYTVARHVSHIFAKTGALNRTEAARFAGRWTADA